MKSNLTFSMVVAMAASAFFFTSCGDKKNLNNRTALNEIAFHLESNPVFETADVAYGEVRFNQRKDAALLASYEALESYGYIRMDLEKEKKRFLSKDTTLSYVIHLTDKSIPFVIDKTDKKAVVQTYYYELDVVDEPLIEQTGKNRAKVTVTMHRRETDFSDFATNSLSNNASFIKKAYQFRFDENSGWRVVK